MCSTLVQIWATGHLPNTAQRKDVTQRVYFEKHGTPMLLDYCALEIEKQVKSIAACVGCVTMVLITDSSLLLGAPRS